MRTRIRHENTGTSCFLQPKRATYQLVKRKSCTKKRRTGEQRWEGKHVASSEGTKSSTSKVSLTVLSKREDKRLETSS